MPAEADVCAGQLTLSLGLREWEPPSSSRGASAVRCLLFPSLSRSLCLCLRSFLSGLSFSAASGSRLRLLMAHMSLSQWPLLYVKHLYMRFSFHSTGPFDDKIRLGSRTALWLAYRNEAPHRLPRRKSVCDTRSTERATVLL